MSVPYVHKTIRYCLTNNLEIFVCTCHSHTQIIHDERQLHHHMLYGRYASSQAAGLAIQHKDVGRKPDHDRMRKAVAALTIVVYKM